jgi:hypothetical protein
MYYYYHFYKYYGVMMFGRKRRAMKLEMENAAAGMMSMFSSDSSQHLFQRLIHVQAAQM